MQLLPLPWEVAKPSCIRFSGTLVPQDGWEDPGSLPDLGCFSAELVAHGDLVQGAVWSRDGALVGTMCKVSRWTVRLKCLQGA